MANSAVADLLDRCAFALEDDWSCEDPEACQQLLEEVSDYLLADRHISKVESLPWWRRWLEWLKG